MGRGRAKAKQQKVARELKYSTHNTDLTALQRELSGYAGDEPATAEDADSEDEDQDEFDEWADTAR